jgi:purine-binding chemotaxis protein CheW
VSLDETQSDRIVQMAAFRVGDEDYVIDIMRIKEIINPLKVTAVHDSTGLLEGVINLRGVIIPVIDLRGRLGLSRAEDTQRTKVIIASVGPKIVGFRVDEVLEVVRMPRSRIRPSPQLGPGGEQGLFLGVCQHDERLLLLLNLRKVLTPAFFQSADKEEPSTGEV